MKILGIDHATVHAGIAVLDTEDVSFRRLQDIDCKTFPFITPLQVMFNITSNFIDTFAPDVVALEKPMAMRNADTARKLIEVYAACKLAAMMKGVEIVEVTPQLAKIYVAGNKNADKDDVARALQAGYGLDFDEIAVPVFYKDKKRKGKIKERLYDVSDACALCVAAMEIKRKEAV